MLFSAGSLEYGATVNLGSKLPISSSGWSQVEGWSIPSSTVQLYFTYGVTVNSQELTSNKEGIFFVSMNIYITDGNSSAQYQALVAVDEFDNIGQVQNGIRAAQKGFSSGTLYAAGYMYLRQDSVIRVYVYSDITDAYDIDVKSAVTVNFQDNLGTRPGFLASLRNVQTLSSGLNSIGGWTTSGTTALFNSKGGKISSSNCFLPFSYFFSSISLKIHLYKAVGSKESKVIHLFRKYCIPAL